MLGTLAMVWAVLVTAVQLCARNVTEHPKTHIVAPVTKDRVPQIFVAVLDAVFAFGGQENWVRWSLPLHSSAQRVLEVAMQTIFTTFTRACSFLCQWKGCRGVCILAKGRVSCSFRVQVPHGNEGDKGLPQGCRLCHSIHDRSDLPSLTPAQLCLPK